jgi:hypothetical protein
MNAEKIKECRDYCVQSLERGRKSAMFSVEEVTALLDEVEAMRDALQNIADLDAAESPEGFNEWGEAWCFTRAQEFAKAELSKETP